ncbi:MAG TPA: hypothetical protein VFT95_16220 [Micromonosporaceae bacterium]|nr:hypothetical protein [Micromonosporaceae bacterium]
MSTTLTPETALTAPSGTSRVRAAIVSVILAAGAAAIAAVVLWQPWGERDHLSYADLAPHRDAMWWGTLIDGLAFAAVGVTLAIAVCGLVPARRGAALATVGAVLTGFGGVAFCAGMVAFGSLAWYVTDPGVVPPENGTTLMTYIEDNPGHVMGAQMAGFLLYTLGSLLLMAALWRARAVPRWLPIGYLLLTVGLFALDGVALNIVQAAQTLLLVPIAVYAVRAAKP